MTAHLDNLFGRIELPEWMEGLALTAEVQRLRDIRLINTSTPSLAALSDVKRYTHTLGVVHLAKIVADHLRFNEIDSRTFLASALLHDVGTPAFGHLFEYLLNAKWSWTHEEALRSIIDGTYRPENKYHQVYFNRPLGLQKQLARLGIEPDLVCQTVLGRTPAGRALAGSIDVDNLDNVYRMAAALGLHPSAGLEPTIIAASLTLDLQNGRVSFPLARLHELRAWRETRRNAYRALLFNSQALASQAILTEALSLAMQDGTLDYGHWFLTDEQLLQFLSTRGQRRVAELVRDFATARYPKRIVTVQAVGHLPSIDIRAPDNRRLLQQELSAIVRADVIVYVSYDSGTLERPLDIGLDNTSAEVPEDMLTRSQSTIIGIFGDGRLPPGRRRLQEVAQCLKQFGLPSESVKEVTDHYFPRAERNQDELPI